MHPGSEGPCPHAQNLDATLNLSIGGQTLSERYQIEREIGRGGMGIVYLARDLSSADGQELVAIKLLATSAAQNESIRNRFLAEARAASALCHRSIVKLRDFAFTAEGLPFMVMDYIQGECLSNLLEAGKIDSLKALQIAIDLCDAFDHAHNRRIIHRDIKPSNIMICGDIDQDFNTIVVDFGIAKIFSEPGEVSLRLTETGEVFGSPLYMSPEQCMGQKVDKRSDIYSLGCVLYECLTGSSPFQGDNFLNVIFKHINDSPQPFVATAPYKTCQTVVFRALSKKPADRFSSMTEFRQSLQCCFNNLSQPTIPGVQANYVNQSGLTDNTQDRHFLHTLGLAREGFAPAQLDLACIYEDGVAVAKDLEEAFKWCLEAATQGLTEAEIQLGDYFKLGIGTAVDTARSAYWYKKAALAGHTGAMSQLGFYYGDGGPEPNAELSIEWFKKAALADNEIAQYTLGLNYTLGLDVPKDDSEAAKWFERAAQQGHGDSQYQLGQCYEYGNGVEQDHALAFKWYKLAAEQGVATAQCSLACMYEFGRGTKIDTDLAVKWMTEASSNGEEWSSIFLAQWYTFGLYGLPVDYTKSLKLLRHAAQAGCGAAMYGLGNHYLKGMGVVQNAKTAAHWFTQAVESGDSLAKYELAKLYMDGYGVNKDSEKGHKLLESAAIDDVDLAQYELGLHYKKLGALDQAELWLQKAKFNGHTDASDALNNLRNNNKDFDT